MENQNNKPKLKSFFSNNANSNEKNAISGLEKKLDLLARRVKILEDQLKRMKNEQSERES